MGILSPPPTYPCETMKIQVMCDQSKEHCSSKLLNGEGESVPIVSMSRAFEDIDNLKACLNDMTRDSQEVGESYHNDHKPDLSSPDDDGDELVKSDHSSMNLLPDCEFKDSKHRKTAISVQNSISEAPPPNGLSQEGHDITFQNVALIDSDKNHYQDQCDHFPSDHVTSSAQTEISPFDTQDIAVDVGDSDSARFSRVLENISLPLLYIPTTKQLIAQEEQASNLSAHNSDSHNIPEILCREHLSEDVASENFKIDFDSVENHSLGILATPSSLSSCGTTNALLSPNSNSEFSVSVFNQDSFNSPDYLRPCDIPSTSHFFADNVSLSSVSTGTDFSVSAFSVNDDFGVGENRSLSHALVNEDSAFMDINLHSRNSYDTSHKGSSLENSHADINPPTVSDSKKGLSSFK